VERSHWGGGVGVRRGPPSPGVPCVWGGGRTGCRAPGCGALRSLELPNCGLLGAFDPFDGPRAGGWGALERLTLPHLRRLAPAARRAAAELVAHCARPRPGGPGGGLFFWEGRVIALDRSHLIGWRIYYLFIDLSRWQLWGSGWPLGALRVIDPMTGWCGFSAPAPTIRRVPRNRRPAGSPVPSRPIAPGASPADPPPHHRALHRGRAQPPH